MSSLIKKARKKKKKRLFTCAGILLHSPSGAGREGAAVPKAPWIILNSSCISLDCFDFYLRGRGKKGVLL